VTLPTEAQWEYACRAGTDTPLSFGDLDADFAPYANMADTTLRELAYGGWRPLAPDLVPRDTRFDDGALVTARVASYAPNAWGLHDMHGNASEWTRSLYDPLPKYGNTPRDSARRAVRGGSWRDRPRRCRSASRLGYASYQRVFNVGFRVVIEEPRAGVPALAHWTFDEPASDSSIPASGGTAMAEIRTPSPVPRIRGVHGSALRLAGSHALAIAPGFGPASMEEITFSAWTRPADLGGYREIFRQESGDRGSSSPISSAARSSPSASTSTGTSSATRPSTPPESSTAAGTTAPPPSTASSCASTSTAPKSAP